MTRPNDPPRHAAAELETDRGAHLRAGRARARAGQRARSSRITPRESQPERQPAEELVQHDVARQHRHAGSRRLVHDLVERLAPVGLRRAEKHVGRREQRGDAVARDRRARARTRRAGRARGDDPLELPAMLPPPPSSGPAHGSRARRRGPRAVASSSPSSIVVYPFQGVMRPSARSRSGPSCRIGRGRRGLEAADVDRVADAPHLGCSERERPPSTLSTTSARRVARRSDRSAFQCVYQRPSGIRCSLQSGAASVRNTGTMWASTASGRSAPRRSSAASSRSNASPRPTREAEPRRSGSRTFGAHRVAADAVAEDDDLVAATGESRRPCRSSAREQDDPRRRPG